MEARLIEIVYPLVLREILNKGFDVKIIWLGALMGRRKRKKVAYRRVKILPKIFKCPKCGNRTMKARNRTKTIEISTVECPKCSYTSDIDPREKKNVKICPNCGSELKVKTISREQRFSTIKCGTCGEEEEVLADNLTEPVDAFGRYIDIFYAEQEYDRLFKLSKILDRKGEWSELANVYSYLAYICKVNRQASLKKYEQTQNADDLKAADQWRQSGEEFKKREKDILEKLELKQLEEGKSLMEDESAAEELKDLDLADQEEEEKKKGNDIFSDPGFLEF